MTTSTTLGRLRLKNGDYADGMLTASSNEGKVHWKYPAIAEPVEFDIAAIRSIDTPPRDKAAAAAGEYAIQMHSGDRFFGNLTSWSSEKVTLSTQTFGSINLKPDWIKHIHRWEDAPGVLFNGPRSMDEWKVIDEAMKWTIESGSLISTENGAKIRGKVGLVDRVQIDLRISWSRQPNFVMAFGVSEDQTSAGTAFSIEVWDDKLALVRDIGAKADAAYLEQLDPKKAFVELTIFLDQAEGRAVVYSERGNQLADITLRPEKPQTQPCVILENFGRELRLDQIRVQNWTTQLPVERKGEANFVVERGGQLAPGKIKSFDASSGWTIVGADGERSVAADQLMEIVQAEPPKPSTSTNEPADAGTAEAGASETPASSDSTAKAEPATSPSVEIVTVLLQDQSRILGKWISASETKIVIQPECAVSNLEFPIAELAALRGNATDYSVPKKEDAREGQLILQGLQLSGYFSDGVTADQVTCLGWQPRFASNVVHLLRSANGRIDFRKPDLRTNVAAAQRDVRFGGRNAANTPTPAPANARRATVPNIMLRSGDLILAELIKVDEKGVTFKSPLTPTSFLPHDQIQSVELKRPRRDRAQAAQKMARLLTVPRARKNDPPTHLISSTDGDFLRGRLVRIEDNHAIVEVRLEEVKVPMEKVAQIVWLHDRLWDDKKPNATAKNDEAAAKAEETKSSDSDPSFLVHAVERSGWKMTFDPKSLQGDNLSGISSLLGDCAVQLKNIDFLLIGPKIEERARELTSNPWALSLAKLPQVYLDEENGESGGSNAGTSSALVGKPAPKLEAEGIDGTPFKLTDMKGRVVVLDFWASWCGPCMQTMPAIDGVVKDMASQDLDLVAVNLEEPAERAQAAMERLKLDTKVVLDLDGVAAQRYQATAIPQTVIIDRQGIVRHVFVGGGPKMIEQFRSSLQKVLDENTAVAQ